MVTPFNESPAALNKLINDLIVIISSEYQEVANAGVRAVNSLVGKILDKLMDQSLSMIEETFEDKEEGTSQKHFTFFYHLINCCDEAVAKFRKRIENILSKMIVHESQRARELSSNIFKIFNKILGDENFVRDFIRDNYCAYGAEDDHTLLESKMTFLRALLDDPHLMVSPILTTITLTPKENVESQYQNRAKLLRLWYCQKAAYAGKKSVADPCKMLTLIIRLILDGKALFEIEETSQYIANDTYVTMGTSKEVSDELTLAFGPLISLIPIEKIYEWQEKVEDLYKDCVNKDKMKVYIIFITDFIHHPRFQSDSYVDIYVRNVCKYLDTEDQELLDAVIKCIESGAELEKDADIIAENLSKDWQDSLVCVFRNEAEDVFGIDEEDESFDKDKLAIFESPRGVECLAKIFLNELLTGKQRVRIDAAYNIGLIAKFAPLQCFKKYVIKMAGALIRIANDKFDDEVKVTIFRALRRLFEKAGITMKPISAALKTTFNQYAKQKDISDEVKSEMDKLQEIVDLTLTKKKSKQA